MTSTTAPFELDLSQVLLQAGRHPLAAEVAGTLEHRCNLRVGANVVVGFSGGPDSTALLVLMRALSERQEPPCQRPLAVHVDHGLREDSGCDAEHANALCTALGIECEVVSLELDTSIGNLADRARVARYEALEQIARMRGADAVCVAHHAEDRLESILQALCRGSGAAGLTAPRWVRELGATHLARPLLGTPHQALVEFCGELGIKVLEDPSNVSLDTARGFLRSRVLPALEERWPGAALRASAAADRLQIAAAALEAQLQATFGPAKRTTWPRDLLSGLSVELLSAAFRRAITAYDEELEIDLKDRLPASLLVKVARAVTDGSTQPRTFELAEGWRVQIDVREVQLCRDGTTAFPSTASDRQ